MAGDMSQHARQPRIANLPRTGSFRKHSTHNKTEQALKFQGKIDYPVEDKVDDWGFTPEQQETRVEEFRRALEKQNAWRMEEHDFYMLRRFLRARNYELPAATEMWLNTLQWRREYGVDHIQEEFSFPERERYLMCYPQGYHKVDKQGRPVYIQHTGSINLNEIRKVTTKERMLKYNIQEYERLVKHILPVCSRLANRKIEQTFGILDVKGVGLSHMTGEVRQLLGVITKCNQDNYPELLGHMVIINAPYMFKAVFNIIKGMLNPRTQAKIEICSSDYKETLLKWIDAENLPEYLGGTSKGTLLDDIGPWSDAQVLAQLGASRPCSPLAPARLSITLDRAEDTEAEEEDGYYSPIETDSSGASVRSTAGSGTGAPLLVRQGSLGRGSRRGASSPGPVAGYSPPNMHHNPLVDSHDQAGEGASPLSLSTTHTGSAHWQQQPLVERVARLERELPRQLERLRPWLRRLGDPTSSASEASQRSAPEGTLVWRVETLEEGMELLLGAQELSLREASSLTLLSSPPPRRDKEPTACCRGCCCVM